MTGFGQAGEIITALDPPLLVEAAETVADQEKTEGHRAASGRGHRMERPRGSQSDPVDPPRCRPSAHPVERTTGPPLACLATLIWLLRLSDNLSRKSVAPALSLQQQELSVLAEPALPPSFRPFLATPPPRQALLSPGGQQSEAHRAPSALLALLHGESDPTSALTRGPLIRCWSGCAV